MNFEQSVALAGSKSWCRNEDMAVTPFVHAGFCVNTWFDESGISSVIPIEARVKSYSTSTGDNRGNRASYCLNWLEPGSIS
jgi:hypothetical protein